MELKHIETDILSLGEPKINSPIQKKMSDSFFVSDDERVQVFVKTSHLKPYLDQKINPPSFELAGPRKKIYFDPSKLRCALVTCGGLCPGLNDIIRSIVLELHYRYHVSSIIGVKYGFQGFIPEYEHEFVNLTPEYVSNISDMGGSILGSSRGAQDISSIVDCLERMHVGILFVIGGDGTLKAATLISDEINNRHLKISVIGIPKTIDNDIYLVARSFGFETAVDIATGAIKGAHNESIGYANGIGLIKLMGRHSGFLAATAALAQQDANYVLIPEVDFDLDGPQGLLEALEKRLALRKHAVIIVAEGAGQKFFANNTVEYDLSGNVKLKDIGLYLKDRILSHFKQKNTHIVLKYIDPSYMIRSLPANADDTVFCGFLGRDAVHAGMTGKTKMIVGNWNNHFVHLPMVSSAGKRKQVNPHGKLWSTILETTGQGSLTNTAETI